MEGRAPGHLLLPSTALSCSHLQPDRSCHLHTDPRACCTAPPAPRNTTSDHPSQDAASLSTPPTAMSSSAAALKAQLKSLGEQRTALELEVAQRSARLQVAGVASDGPLVDSEVTAAGAACVTDKLFMSWLPLPKRYAYRHAPPIARWLPAPRCRLSRLPPSGLPPCRRRCDRHPG